MMPSGRNLPPGGAQYVGVEGDGTPDVGHADQDPDQAAAHPLTPVSARGMISPDAAPIEPAPPNNEAQQRQGPSERRIWKSLHAPAVCCSAWFGLPLL